MSVPQPVTVSVNGRPCYLNEHGRLNVKNTFGKSAVLMDCYGTVIPLDEHGEAPLYPTGTYTISDKAVIGLPSTVETQWEFAELGTNEGSSKVTKSGEEWKSDVYVRYHSNNLAGGKPKILLAESKKALPYNPFSAALAQMGAAGWEMVSMQHGSAGNGSVRFDNKVAYFKRVQIPGRQADVPAIVLQQPDPSRPSNARR